MVLRNHRYIEDGIGYNSNVFDIDGNYHKVAEVWEAKYQKRSPKTFDYIMSYGENEYVVSPVTDVRVCGNKDMVTVYTRAGRQLRTPLGASLITSGGPVVVRNLAIETPLKVVDQYKNYHGDRLALRTDGNARVRAFLRNHKIPFEIGEFGGTETSLGNIYCVEYDTEGILTADNAYTFGLNNWRDGVKALFNLPDHTYDEVTKIVHAKAKYAVAIWTAGVQNIVTETGILVQSTQTEVIDDWSTG